MELKIKAMNLESGGAHIVVLNKKDAAEIGIRSSDRVVLRKGRRTATCLVDVTDRIVGPGQVGVYEEVSEILGSKRGPVHVCAAGEPESARFIVSKLEGGQLDKRAMTSIVKDTVEGHLSDVELAAFISALDFYGMSSEEVFALSEAMIYGGKRLNLNRKVVCDKHSLGGVPGDKTTILVVPIVAAMGLTIPKTSSRAITSPAGTADRVECLCPVRLSIPEIERTVRKTNGCMVWGGSVDLAPADDLFIRIEYPLSIDPLLLPSVMSKKKAVGATHVVIDFPTGRGTKLKTIGAAQTLGRKFITLGSKLGIKTRCLMTFGEEPVGHCVGPALEAREALVTLCNKNGSKDLVEKAVNLAGTLFEMTGHRNGKKVALDILTSGKAEKKVREIIGAQGGDEKIKPEDIMVGPRSAEVRSDVEGRVFWIANHDIVKVARAAGAPVDKGAGMILKKKIGDYVRKGDVLFEIYAEKSSKLNHALALAEDLDMMGIFKSIEQRMLIGRLPDSKVHRRHFIFER